MSEQVKQENEIADLGTEKTTDDKTIGLQEEHTCTVICEDSEGTIVREKKNRNRT